ncbi:MAG: outer membrane protein assembly factor BamB family protein [Planctomycetota bacterium]|jgi:glucose dehydrogenase
MFNHHKLLLSVALISLVSVADVHADNWPAWRGPTGDGVAPAGEFPISWSGTKNIAWKIELPGRGASTPIVWGDSIFLTYGKDGKNVLACLSRSGEERWSVDVGEERAGKHKKASGSNPSCATDGSAVYAYFKSGDLAAVNFDGSVIWHHNLQDMYGEDTLWWDLGTSPVLTKDVAIVAVMQTGPSYLAAFDKKSGKVAWKQDRNVPAPSEAAQSYSTPIVTTIDGKERIFVLGADHVTAHDASSGKELWRVGGLNPDQEQYFRSISSPVLAGSTLVAPYARGNTVTGINLGGKGDVTKSHVKWTKASMGADVPTPTVKGSRVFVCRDKGVVSELDAATGKVVNEVELEKNRARFSASPVLVGDRLYVVREDGKCFVLSIAGGLKLIGSNELDEDEFVVATPVFVDGQILLRTYDRLYCISK